jgi:hypothetical protein
MHAISRYGNMDIKDLHRVHDKFNDHGGREVGLRPKASGKQSILASGKFLNVEKMILEKDPMTSYETKEEIEEVFDLEISHNRV